MQHEGGIASMKFDVENKVINVKFKETKMAR